MSKNLKVLKKRFKKAKQHLSNAELNHYQATKHGSEKQIALCKTRLEKSQIKFDKASEKLNAAKKEQPNLISRTITKVKESPIKKIFSWTGLAITAVVTTITGVVIYDYMHQDDEDISEATDTV
jgi:hypothetical protein